MNRTKTITILTLIFIVAAGVAIYFDNSYRIFVRFILKSFHGDSIRFFGKDFRLFSSPYYFIATGIYFVVLATLLLQQSSKRRIIFLIITAAIFFISNAATIYFDGVITLQRCIDCEDGIKNLHYNSVKYDFHFITGLLVSLMPLLWVTLIKKNSVSTFVKPVSSAQ